MPAGRFIYCVAVTIWLIIIKCTCYIVLVCTIGAKDRLDDVWSAWSTIYRRTIALERFFFFSEFLTLVLINSHGDINYS